MKIIKKGATIAEMIVALAVVAVVSTVVLTFATLVHTRSIIASAKLEALQDMTLQDGLKVYHPLNMKYLLLLYLIR